MRTTKQFNVVTRFDKRGGAARANRAWEWSNFYNDRGAAGSGGFEPRAGEGGEHWDGKGGKEKGGKDKGGMDKGGKDGKGKRAFQ